MPTPATRPVRANGTIRDEQRPTRFGERALAPGPVVRYPFSPP